MATSPLPPLPTPMLPPAAPSPPAEEEGGSKDLWYIGAIINVVGSVSINLGMNLMKMGHTKRAMIDLPEEEKPPIRKFKSWLFGIIIFSLGNVLNFVSFAFAAQSLLAALGSLQLVCNVVFAYFLNHEPITKLIIASTFCIIGGCVLLVVFGNQSSETYTVDELIDLYTEPAYIVYLVMMGVFVFGFYVLYMHGKRIVRGPDSTPKQRNTWFGVLIVAYAIFSALLGSQSVLFGKSMSVILRGGIEEKSAGAIFGNWYTYVALGSFCFTAIFWVMRLNKGLRMFPAMLIVPLMQIAWTLFSIVSGMIYFQEYKGFNVLKAVMFPIGVLVVFFGVFLLTIGGSAPDLSGPQEEPVDGSKPSQMTVHDNAMFAGREGEGTAPSETRMAPAKMSLGETLRFTTPLWAPASTMSPGSHMNRTLNPTDSMARQRRITEASDLNATGRTNRTDEYWGNSTLNRTHQSNMSRVSETPSNMGATMRRGMKNLGNETKTGFKLAMGLGDSGLTAVSLFAMPALDFTATKRTSRSGGTNAEAAAIQHALPGSRFYKGGQGGEGLQPIREGSGLPTQPHGSELGNSLTGSSQMRGSSGGSAGGAASGKEKDKDKGKEKGKDKDQAAEGGKGKPPPLRVPSGNKQPLDADTLLGMLPGPTFKPSRSNGADAPREPPKTPALMPGGVSFRPGKPGGQELPPKTPDLGLGAPPPPTAYNAAGGESDRSQRPSGGPLPVNASVDFGPGFQAINGGGGTNGAGYANGPGTSWAGNGVGGGGNAGGGRPMPRPGSLGTLLPEGVPLSSANSLVMHDSRPSTPPEVMLNSGGPSGRVPSPLVHQAQQQQQQYQQPFQQVPVPPLPLQAYGLSQPQYQQQYQQQQYVQQNIPLSLLQRAQAPPLAGSARLPPLHLMVPGMPIGAGGLPAQVLQPAVHPSVLQYGSPSASYAQVLASVPEGVTSAGGLAPALSAPPRALLPMQSLASAGSLGGAGGSGLVLHSRHHSPRGGLSVSRSWAGFGSGGGALAPRPSGTSPVRGSYLGHMQRPLRPGY